jgi:hypothetical protein
MTDIEPDPTLDQLPEPGSPVWQEPPGRTGLRTGLWNDLLHPFVDNPGQWGIVRTYPNPRQAENIASNLRRTKHKPPGIWKFTSRSIKAGEAGESFPEGRSDLYALYMGLNGEYPDPKEEVVLPAGEVTVVKPEPVVSPLTF